MATIDDLITASSQSSPIEPLRSTTLPDTGDTFSGEATEDPYGKTSDPSSGEYEWDTPSEVYEFGRQRLDQQLQEMGAAGPQAVQEAVWQRDVRVSGGAGGMVIRDYSEESYKYQKRLQAAREAVAKKNWARQQAVLRARQRFLEERLPYQHPISDIV